MAKKKENTSAKQPKKETAEANDPKKAAKQKKPSKSIKKVRIIGGVAYLGLPFNFGQEVEVGKSLSESQAQELIDIKRAEDIS